MFIGTSKMLICIFSSIDSKILYKNEYKFTELKNQIDEITIINFLARLNIDGDIFLIGSNGKLTKNFALSNSETLPFIFGSPDVEEFLEIFSIINTSGLKYESIKNLFFYKSGRIDLEMKDNILIKLPIDNLKNVLKNISQLISNDQFNKKTIDARVSNQIILYD